MGSMASTQKQANKTSSDKAEITKGNTGKLSTIKKPNPLDIIHRVRINPALMTQSDMIYLQSVIGNRGVAKLLSGTKNNEELKKEDNKVKTSPIADSKDNTQFNLEISNKEIYTKSEKVERISADSQLKSTGRIEQQNQKSEEVVSETSNSQTTNELSSSKSEAPKKSAEDKESQSIAKSEEIKPEVGKQIDNKVKSEPEASKNKSNNELGSPEVKTQEKNPEDKNQSDKRDEEKNAEVENQMDSIIKGGEISSGDQETSSNIPGQKTGLNPKENSIGSQDNIQSSSPSGSEQHTKSPITAGENSPLVEKGQKKPSKPLKVSIKGENPGEILNQLENAPPAAIFDAYTQSISASSGALNNQKQKTQEVIPEVPAPTGLKPTQSPGKKGNRPAPVNHTVTENFRSEKSGGDVYAGMPADFNPGSDSEVDPERIMDQARAQSKAAPQIGMTGEADPSQMQGFKSEADQSVQAAKQAELAQVNNDFGEKNIYPEPDNTTLKAGIKMKGITPPNGETMQTFNLSQDIADRINQPLSATLKGQIAAKRNEYQKGKEKFDADVIAAKADTNSQIEQQKVEAKEKQISEQNKAKAEVNGLRGEWRSEIDGAVSEYDKKADSASQEKSKEIGDIKTQKEGEVQKELASADKEAQKEYKAAKADAEAKKKEKEDDKRSWFEKGWDWVKDKAQQAIDTLKKAVNFIFDGLRKAVKYIFDKAKQAAMSIIEAGRKMIVGLIKKLGSFLKGLVKVVFARFPALANKICSKIDGVVNKAIAAVNKAADLLKKGVTAALNLLAKTLDGFFGAIQSLYNGILSSIGKLLNGGFKELFLKALEAAEIAAEIALAFATGGGSVLAQIVIWLAKTLPELFRKVSAVLGFVDTIRNFKLDNIKQFLDPMKIGEFLVKGLFGELSPLNQVDGDDKKKDEEPKEDGKATGLLKVFSVLQGVFKMLKGVYNKVAGAINKVLPMMNISTKPWFDMFSMIYAGAVKAMEVVQNPAEALGEGVEKLKEAISSFFGNIKSKVVETAEGVKEKIMIIGKPTQLMKLIANKAVDMVLNFLITHPPSALIKAVFKVIEAVSGKSIVDLVRQYIPFADKLLNKIAESGPVSGLLKPLAGPVNRVGGMIDEVSGKAVNMVDESEQKSVSVFGSGAKVLKELAGNTPGNKNAAGAGGDKKGGGILGVIKGGIHTRLLALGQKLLQKGKSIIKTSVGKIKGLIFGPKIGFKMGNESHELWVEKRGDRNVVMMASTPTEVKKIIDKNKGKNVKLLDEIEELESAKDEKQVTKPKLDEVATGVSEAAKGNSNPKPIDEMSYEEIKTELAERYKIFVKEKRQSVPQTSDKFLPGEMEFGLYGKLENDDGDNITGHHMPSKAYMKANYNISEKDGLALFLEHIYPGKGGRHKRTFTYGRTGRDKQLYEKLLPNDALEFDINDVRRILKEDGLLNEVSERKLREYVAKCKELFPNIFKN